MSALTGLLWLVNILLDTAGQLAFKSAAASHVEAEHPVYWRHLMHRPAIWLGVGCFAVKIIAWLAFLSVVPLAQGVLLGSFNIVVIMIAGRLLFQEQLSPLRVTGILLVTAGVTIVGAS